jgi:uncharacterized protein (DUF736 family)
MSKSDVKPDDSILTPTTEVKSRILDRISKEVEKSKHTGNGSEFHVVTGEQNAGEGPVMATYYKGGSYVKTSTAEPSVEKPVTATYYKGGSYVKTS